MGSSLLANFPVRQAGRGVSARKSLCGGRSRQVPSLLGAMLRSGGGRALTGTGGCLVFLGCCQPPQPLPCLSHPTASAPLETRLRRYRSHRTKGLPPIDRPSGARRGCLPGSRPPGLPHRGPTASSVGVSPSGCSDGRFPAQSSEKGLLIITAPLLPCQHGYGTFLK